MTISYFEKVLIAKSDQFPHLVGRIGVVLGISADDDCVHGYAVYLDEEACSTMFLPEDLVGLNEFVQKSDFYREGDRITVRVIDGAGYVVE